MIRSLLLLLPLAACAADGVPWTGEALPAELVLYSPNEGVHPDRSVLEREYPVGKRPTSTNSRGISGS